MLLSGDTDTYERTKMCVAPNILSFPFGKALTLSEKNIRMLGVAVARKIYTNHSSYTNQIFRRGALACLRKKWFSLFKNERTVIPCILCEHLRVSPSNIPSFSVGKSFDIVEKEYSAKLCAIPQNIRDGSLTLWERWHRR